MDDILRIIQLFIPIITFAMGYFLTDIGYKRDRKISIIREKFEKLYHPFYLLLHELGTNQEDGESLEIGGESYSELRPFFKHLTANMYLASPEGQKHFIEAHKLFLNCCVAEGGSGSIDSERDRQFGKSFDALVQYLMSEYVKAAKTLGYEIGE